MAKKPSLSTLQQPLGVTSALRMRTVTTSIHIFQAPAESFLAYSVLLTWHNEHSTYRSFCANLKTAPPHNKCGSC